MNREAMQMALEPVVHHETGGDEMTTKELHPIIDRLVSQMRYAYEHGGGHSGHLNNAMHTAKVVSAKLHQLESELEPHFVHLTGQEDYTLDPQELADALADDLVAGEEVTEEVFCYWVLPKRKMWVTVTNEIDGNNRVVWRWV